MGHPPHRNIIGGGEEEEEYIDKFGLRHIEISHIISIFLYIYIPSHPILIPNQTLTLGSGFATIHVAPATNPIHRKWLRHDPSEVASPPLLTLTL